MFAKTLSLDIERAYNVLISETNSKFSKGEAKTTFKTQQIILIYPEVRIYLDSPSKVLKFKIAVMESHSLAIFFKGDLS